MKNYIAGTIIATGLIVLILGIDCKAQTSDRLVADIPFEFNVGDDKLPAGRYEFEPANRHAHPGALIMRSVSGSRGQSWILAASTGDSSRSLPDSSVIFSRYGSIHYLSKVNLDSGRLTVALRKTPDNRRLTKQTRRPETVVIGSVSRKGN